MTNDRRVAEGLIALTLSTMLLVLLGIDGSVRTVVSLAFVLAAPGLALSLLMGPMSIEARLLVTVAASAALVTTVSLVLVAAGVWSGAAGLAVLAAIVLSIAVPRSRRRPSALPPPTAARSTITEPISPGGSRGG